MTNGRNLRGEREIRLELVGAYFLFLGRRAVC
jgi:hypothetical protein